MEVCWHHGGHEERREHNSWKAMADPGGGILDKACFLDLDSTEDNFLLQASKTYEQLQLLPLIVKRHLVLHVANSGDQLWHSEK